MFKASTFAIGALLLAAFSSRTTAAAAEVPAEVLVVIENAERLRTGQYAANGRITSRSWQEGDGHSREHDRTDEYDLSIESAFDLNTDRTLFRVKQTHVGGPIPNLDFTEHYAWYLHVPDQTVELRGNERRRTAVIHLPTPVAKLWTIDTTPLPRFVLDPRLLAWPGWEFRSVSFDDFVKNSLRKSELRTTDEGNGIHRIEVWITIEEGYNTVLTLWCDKRQGGQPVRSSGKWHYTSPVRRAEQRNRNEKPFSESEQSWERHGDVWVVKSLSAITKRGTEVNEIKVSFDWQNVNQDVPGERFDWGTWSFPNDYQDLEDRRLGEHRAIDVTDLRGPPYERDLTLPFDTAQASQAGYWLVIANVSAFGLVAGWLSRRALMS